MISLPPLQPDQPILHLVPTRENAIKNMPDWDAPASGSGYVTKFEVKTSYLNTFNVEEAGWKVHMEHWTLLEELAEFCDAIVGNSDFTDQVHK